MISFRGLSPVAVFRETPAILRTFFGNRILRIAIKTFFQVKLFVIEIVMVMINW